MAKNSLGLILRAIIVLAIIYIAMQIFGISLPAWGSLILLIVAILIIFNM